MTILKIRAKIPALQRTQVMVEEVRRGGGVMCFRSSRVTTPYRRKQARESTINALNVYVLFIWM